MKPRRTLVPANSKRFSPSKRKYRIYHKEYLHTVEEIASLVHLAQRKQHSKFREFGRFVQSKRNFSKLPTRLVTFTHQVQSRSGVGLKFPSGSQSIIQRVQPVLCASLIWATQCHSEAAVIRSRKSGLNFIPVRVVDCGLNWLFPSISCSVDLIERVAITVCLEAFWFSWVFAGFHC